MFKGDTGDKGSKGDDGCCNNCQNWSVWNPDPNQVCDGENFWQNRYCLDNSGVGSGIGSGGGGLQYEWRSAIGTAIPNWGPWTPDPSTVCVGTFTQTSTDLNGACGNRYQSETGTKLPNWGPWTPDSSIFCEGVEFTQSSIDLNGCQAPQTQTSIGTKLPNWGPWTPNPSTVCNGTSFTQTRTDLNGCQTNETQTATGTSIPNWGSWTPDPSTQPYGQSFTQTRSDLNGKCENDTQFAIGTRVCGNVSFDITGGSIVWYDYFDNGCIGTRTGTFTSYDGSTLQYYFVASTGGTYTGSDPNYVCSGGYTIPNAKYLEVGVGGSSYYGQTTFTVHDLYGYLQGSVTIVPPTTPGVYTYNLPITLVNRPTQSGSYAGVVTITVTPC